MSQLFSAFKIIFEKFCIRTSDDANCLLTCLRDSDYFGDINNADYRTMTQIYTEIELTNRKNISS